MRGTRALGAVVALAVTLSVASVAVESQAAELPPGDPLAGVRLPKTIEAPRTDGGVTAASSSFALHDLVQLDVVAGQELAVVRLSDGAQVRVLPGDQFAGSTTELVDDALVSVTGEDDRARMVVTDVATGETRAQRTFPWDRVLVRDDRWAMTAAASGDDGRHTLRVWHVDGTDVEVDRTFRSTVSAVGGDSSATFVSDGSGTWQIDPDTGTTEQVLDADTHVFAVTDRSLLATRDGISQRPRLVVRDRVSGAEQVSPPVDRTHWTAGPFVPHGDGVAMLRTTTDGGRRLLEPVDLGTGALLDPVADLVGSLRTTGDGRVAGTTRDGTGSRLVLTPGPDGGLREVTRLTPLADRAQDLALVDGRVLASWAHDFRGVWSRSATGSGPWQHTYADASAGSSLPDGFAAGGDVVVVPLRTARDVFRVSWPGGSRDVSAREVGLSRDGHVLIRDPVRGTRELQDARTGEVLPASGPTVALDGRWAWGPADARGRITGTDLRGELPDEHVDLGATCAEGLPATVWGRWVLGICGDDVVVVDRAGRRPVLRPARASLRALGRGFLVLQEPYRGGTVSAGGAEVVQLVVVDLVTGAERRYGPVYEDVAVDAAGRPALAYVDVELQVGHVELGWLTPAAQPDDLRPPVLTSSPDVPRHSRTSQALALAWSFLDPVSDWSASTGVASHEVRTRSLPSGAWRTPPEWQRLARPAVSVRLSEGAGACYQARARDAAGNTGGWSPEVCHGIDGRAPTLVSGARVAPLTEASEPVAVDLAWAYTDGDPRVRQVTGLASYDVRTRRTTESTWSEPSGWQRMTAPELTTELTPGEGRCWSSRARDAIGNVSGWSPEACTYADGQAPSTPVVSGSRAALAQWPTRVRFSARATDDDAVSHYEVQVRRARPGGPRGDWQHAAVSPTGSYTSARLLGGEELCVRARAVDRVLLHSAWSRERCSVAPVDDRRMVTYGRTGKVTSARAIGGTYTRLQRRGAAMTTQRQRGRSIGVWVVRGPRLGAVDVYVDKRRVGRVRLAGTAGRALVTLPIRGGFTGRVRLVSASPRPALVDGVTVLR